jgi:hypothetical protein
LRDLDVRATRSHWGREHRHLGDVSCHIDSTTAERSTGPNDRRGEDGPFTGLWIFMRKLQSLISVRG